ncbi:MAG: Coq4 family protein, partial [Pseudomonadota bacterium]
MPFSYSDEVPEDQVKWIEGFAAPPAAKVRPLHAMISVGRLIANKEDTRQVFETIHALDGGAVHRSFELFVQSEYGRRVVTKPIKVEEDLDERERLRAMPEGSVGRAYLRFMESEGLTSQGVLDAAKEMGADHDSPTQFEEFRRMTIHQEVVHDLWHVLNGYGRDALGELCVLSFTEAQLVHPGVRLIVSVGGTAAMLENPKYPISGSLREARRRGKAACYLMTEDID